jgi:hypothetical protein
MATLCTTTVASTATSANSTLTRSHRTYTWARFTDERLAGFLVRPGGGVAAMPHGASFVLPTRRSCPRVAGP